jgi:sulfite exporter TauE/SafE
MLAFGLVSSLHCVTMCGPLIAVASAPVRVGSSASGSGLGALSIWQLSYQLGRGITYVALGLLMGFVGQLLSALIPARSFGGGIQTVVGILFILLALFAMLRGKAVSAPQDDSFLGKLLRRFVTSGRARGMFVLGLLTGFLPCGVLYAAFARALAADSALNGGALMFAFWLGSAPLLVLVGLLSGSLLRVIGRYANVLVAAVMVVTGSWLVAKGIANLRSPAPLGAHSGEMHHGG